MKLEHPIDCATPINHAQIYAQLKEELLQGERHWFDKEEDVRALNAVRIFEAIKQTHPAVMRGMVAYILSINCIRTAHRSA